MEKLKNGKKNNRNGKNIWKWEKKYQNMYKIKIGGGHIECPFSRKGQGGLWRVVLCLNSGLALLCCSNYKHYKLLLLLCCCCPNYKTTLQYFITCMQIPLFHVNYFFTCNVVDTFYFLHNFYIRVLFTLNHTMCPHHKKYINKNNQKNFECEKIKKTSLVKTNHTIENKK
jgi:hypothetical protein